MNKVMMKLNECLIKTLFYAARKYALLLRALFITSYFISNHARADFAAMAKTVGEQASAGMGVLPVICYFASACLVAGGIMMVVKKGKDQHSQTGWGSILLCIGGGAALACVTFLIDASAESTGMEVSK